MHLELSFDLGPLDPQVAEEACWTCGACALTFVDARDDVAGHSTKSGPTRGASASPLGKTPDLLRTAVLEPGPGEVRLWPKTRLKCLFAPGSDALATRRALAAALAVDPARIELREVAERAWEREWLEHFHAMRFGERLWVCPHHERVSAPGAVVVTLDPGLAFGTGTHPSTALCLMWLDAHAHLLRATAEHFAARQAPGLDAHAHLLRATAEHFGARVIDYGCGSGILALAAAKLGAREVHCFDIDPQALSAARANAAANAVTARIQVHEHPDTLPAAADVLLANILSGPLCSLAPRFAGLLRRHGEVVLAGLMQHEVADVTGAYAPCFDVVPFGEREGWVGLSGRRY